MLGLFFVVMDLFPLMWQERLWSWCGFCFAVVLATLSRLEVEEGGFLGGVLTVKGTFRWIYVRGLI